MKKYIFSIISIFVLCICINNVYGAFRSTDVRISYITAQNKNDGNKKISFYNTKGYEEYDDGAKNVEADLGVPFSGTATSFYRKYIYRNNLDGMVAYCLDPGRDADDYYYIEDTEEDVVIKNFKNLSTLDKYYAAIYDSDFSSISFNYRVGKLSSDGITITIGSNSDKQYIIKQLLFWMTASRGAGWVTGGFGSTSIAAYGDLLVEDITSSILHYSQVKEGVEAKYTNISRLYNEIVASSGETVYDMNYQAIEDIFEIVKAKYNELDTNNNVIHTTIFYPKNGVEGNPGHQRFYGVYVEPTPDDDDPTPEKKYAIVTKYGSTYTLKTDWTTFTSNKTINAPTAKSGYTCVGYKVLRSSEELGGSKDIAEKNYADSGSRINGTKCTLNYDDAWKYNVIVFEYEAPKEYTVTINYFARPAGGSYTSIGSSTKKGKVGQDISVPKSYGSYNKDFYKSSSSNSSVTITNGTDELTFKMPNSNITINVYFQYGRLDYAYVLKLGTQYGDTLDSGVIYNKDNKWNPESIPSKESTLYTNLNSEFLKLEYIGGEYITGETANSVLESELRKLNKGTALSTLTIKDFAHKRDFTRAELYYQLVNSTKVIVRHYVKNSDDTYSLNNSLANSSAIVKHGTEDINGVTKGTFSKVNNGYSQRKSVLNKKLSTFTSSEIAKVLGSGYRYSEIYEIDNSDIILIDRSRTYMLDGRYYECLGFKTSTASSIVDGQLTGAVNSSSDLRQTIQGGSKFVYVDYYYEPVDYSDEEDIENQEDDDDDSDDTDDLIELGDYGSVDKTIALGARLRFVSKTSDGTYSKLGTNGSVIKELGATTENGSTVYVPASENLKPYVVSEICRPNTLKYDFSINGTGNIVYSVPEYKVLGVSTDSNMANVESVNGGVDKVYDAAPNMNVDKNSVDNVIKDTVNIIQSDINDLFAGTSVNTSEAFYSKLYEISKNKLDETLYNDSLEYNVASNKYNGLRQPTGNIKYKVYNVNSTTVSNSTENVNSKISATNSMKINVYTPVELADMEIKSKGFVNHSDKKDTTIIQQGVTFDIVLSTKENTSYNSDIYNNIKNTGKYVKYWYLMFDFDVRYNGKIYSAGEEVIKVDASKNATAKTVVSGLQAVTSSTAETTVQSISSNIKAIAATINIKDDGYANEKIANTTVKSKDGNTTTRIANGKISKGESSDLGLNKASYYLVNNRTQTVSIGRIFDFEITDCLDVNFKDVFRILNNESASTSAINELTGVRYFSGIRRLVATDSVTSVTTNSLVNRSNLQVGSVTKILPLGPYKHTTNSYINSVKLGYRFSFDLKTSGYYMPDSSQLERSVKITPSYYYISKDGKTYNDNIKLYYKNSSGKYVDFETSNYTIYYKPDDGYRNLYNSSTYSATDVSKTTVSGVTTLTNSLVGLKIGNNSGFTLSDSKSMTISDNGYLQAWYGEFKLPNSTIALAVDKDGNIDINKPLTDGYVGVKFDIKCIDKYTSGTTNKEVIVSYNSNDTGIDGSNINTTQWDYEGYLGFKESNLGNKLIGTLKIQLENGVWNINNDMYQKIKGTVIFYDTDNRAANDYD